MSLLTLSWLILRVFTDTFSFDSFPLSFYCVEVHRFFHILWSAQELTDSLIQTCLDLGLVADNGFTPLLSLVIRGHQEDIRLARGFVVDFERQVWGSLDQSCLLIINITHTEIKLSPRFTTN